MSESECVSLTYSTGVDLRLVVWSCVQWLQLTGWGGVVAGWQGQQGRCCGCVSSSCGCPPAAGAGAVVAGASSSPGWDISSSSPWLGCHPLPLCRTDEAPWWA